MKRLEAMFIEFNKVLKAKGVVATIDQVKEMLDYNEHEQANEFYQQRMEDKMDYERALNMYDGLANAVKLVYDTKVQMQDEMEVA